MISQVAQTVSRVLSSVHALIVVVSATVLAAGLALLVVFIAFSDGAEEFTSGRRPTQFYQQLGDDLLDDYASVFGVAHNSGDSVKATREALKYGADVIEIDVVSVNNRLYAAHTSPLPLIGNRFFRGPTLAEVWDAAAEADVIKLDLKESSPRFLSMLFDFLAERDDHQIIVSTRSIEALRAFRERAPRVIRLLSVSTSGHLRSLQSDGALVALIDGVSIRHSLLNKETAAWLKERRLIILAWTVNDAQRMNELVGYGVDAITTDNLAIMELLGGQERGEALLQRPQSR